MSGSVKHDKWKLGTQMLGIAKLNISKQVDLQALLRCSYLRILILAQFGGVQKTTKNLYSLGIPFTVFIIGSL